VNSSRRMKCVLVAAAVWVVANLGACSVPRPDEGAQVAPAGTATVHPTQTSVPTRTPTATPTAVAAPTSLPVPTFTADQERAFVVHMLEANGGCRLPCWWGMMPGETAWQDVRSFFASIGKRTASSQPPAGFIGEMFFVSDGEFRFDYYVGHTFVVEDGLVQSMHVTLGGHEDSEHLQDWEPYALSNLLSDYGAPSQVLVELLHADGGAGPWYFLGLIYDHLGFYVRYSGEADYYQHPAARVCPRLRKMMLIELELRQPQPSQPLTLPGDADYYYPIEQVAGMDMQAFYEAFIDPQSSRCLELTLE